MEKKWDMKNNIMQEKSTICKKHRVGCGSFQVDTAIVKMTLCHKDNLVSKF